MEQPIDNQTLELLQPAGFARKFYELLPFYETQEQTYLAVEKLHHTAFKKNKYANFESFRVVRDRLHKMNEKSK